MASISGTIGYKKPGKPSVVLVSWWSASNVPLRCRFGFHAWDANVPVDDRSAIKRTGNDRMFSSSGIQKAYQHCKLCPAIRVVYREGWVATASDPDGGTKWRYCSPEREREIDRLPPL